MHNLERLPMPVQPPNATPADVQKLGRLAEIAEALGEASTSRDVRRLIDRINEGRFFVACVGQFKRGKSTLLNALVGEQVLPTGVVPVTAVPTVLRYGSQKTARVRIGGKWRDIPPGDLSRYVSEELNPENRKLVEGVEAFLPSALLASGMCLVDTPGIGSVFVANSEATRDFIPQIDAAILVVGADPPISGEELALIEAVAANVDQILIVLNKIDRVSIAERRQAAAFATKVLEARLKRSFGQVYEVSALDELSRTEDGDGWRQFTEDLSILGGKSGQAMTRSATERGVHRFSASLRRSIDERVRALTEPIASSEQRIASLRQTVGQAEQSLRDLGALFSGEQMRLSNTLLTRRKTFLGQILPVVRQEFIRESARVANKPGPARRRELMSIAQSVARHHVMPWLDAEETQAEDLYDAVTRRFVNLVDDLLQQLSREQSSDFSHLPKSFDAEQGFRTRSSFFFHDMITIAQPASPLLYAIDLLMGALQVRRWFEKDADRFLQQLLETNASRVQGDVERRIVDSRLRLESDVRRLLSELSTSAEHALSNARELMETGTHAVQNELDRLRRSLAELDRFAA